MVTTVLAAALVGVVAGCGVPTGSADPIPRDELPESLRTPEAPSSTSLPGPEVAPLAVYWVSERRLVPEPVVFGSSPDPTRLVDLLERGPGTTNAGVRSAVSAPGVLAGIKVDEPAVRVDMGPAFDDLTASEQVLAVAQLVSTLTTVPGIEQVSLRRDGEVVDVPLPDGTLVRRPLVRSDYASLIG